MTYKKLATLSLLSRNVFVGSLAHRNWKLFWNCARHRLVRQAIADLKVAILSPRLVPKTNLPVWRSNSLDNGRRVPLVKG